MAGGKQYEEREVEEILGLAMRQSSSGAIDRERLISMASELGISAEAVADAERQLAANRESEAAERALAKEKIEFKSYRRRRLVGSLSSFFGTNLFFVGIWWFEGHGYFWPFWIMAPWSIGVIGEVFTGLFGAGDFDRDFERWRRRGRGGWDWQ